MKNNTMKWQAQVTTKKRIMASLVSFSGPFDVIVLVMVPVLLALAYYADGGISTLLVVEAIIIVLLPLLLIARAVWIRRRIVAMTGSDIIRYELRATHLRLMSGKDHYEFPR